MKERTEELTENTTQHRLHSAVIAGNAAKVVEFCKSLKAEDISLVDTLNDKGLAPIHVAIQNDKEELLSLLLESGANPNKLTAHGDSCVVLAIKAKSHSMLGRLIEENADINLHDSYGHSPLRIAMDLNVQECTNLLQEHGAIFTKNKAMTHGKEGFKDPTKEYIDAISSLVKSYAPSSHSTIVFKVFVDSIKDFTENYIGKNDSLASVYEVLNPLFNNIVAMLNSGKAVGEKDALNFTRKIIISLHNHIKKSSDNKEHIHAASFLMNKAESSVEEKIVKTKNTAFTCVQPVTDIKQNKSKASVVVKKSVVKENRTKLFNVEFSAHSELSSEKLLSRKMHHEFELIDFHTIKPHHPRTLEELELLIAVSRDKIEMVNSNELERIEKLRRSNQVNIQDLIVCDKAIRVGKQQRLHILVFLEDNILMPWEQIFKQAFEIGATIHCFTYPQKTSHKNDYVYSGIAAINKLLDTGVHPDQIVIQSYGAGALVAKAVNDQFEKRAITFTQIDICDQPMRTANHRYICTSPETKIDKLCCKEMRKMCDNFLKKASKLSNTGSIKNSSLFQLINLFLEASSKTLDEYSKNKNPSTPTERVDLIIGVI